MKPAKRRSISQVLLSMTENADPHDTVTFQELLRTLGDRAYGIAIVLFALPNALPFAMIPGFSLVFSIPIAFFALQLMLGSETIWLPRSLANKKISQAKLNHLIEKSVPYLLKVEHLLKPRLAYLTSWIMERLHGFSICCLIAILMLPIPFSNFIIAVLLILFGVGIAEKDGLVIILAYLGGFVYLSLLLKLISGLLNAIFSFV